MNRKFGAPLLASTAFAMVFAAPVHGQDTDLGADFEQADGTTSEENADVGLSVITVTANRREESLQDVSVPVNAIAGDELLNRGIVDTSDLSASVPALQVQPSGGPALSIYIRGVGSQAGNAFAENAVAFNFNDVYIGRPTALSGTFYDLQRVEVLKGPQGTLYGRNATGGAINVIPNAPRIGEFGGDFTAQYGNYDYLVLSGALNAPLGEVAAVRVAGQVASRDGYLSDGTSDEDSQAGRLSLLVEPTSNLTIRVVGDYAHQGGLGTGSVVVPPVNGAYDAPPLEDRIGATDPLSRAVPSAVAATRFAPPFCGGFGNFVNSGCVLRAGDGGEPFNDTDNYGIAANIDLDLGFGTVTMIPAWRGTSTQHRSYVPGFLIEKDESTDQYSLETRLASNGDNRFGYVLGTFWFKEDLDAVNFFAQGRLATTLFTPQLKTESLAVFGQASYELTDAFRVIGGLRWTKEDKTQVTSLGNGNAFMPDPYNPPLLANFEGDLSFEKITWKAGIEFDAADDSLLYANVATGFKSGGFFVAAPPDNTFAPETLTAYTIGAKNRFADNRIQLNLEAFYWDYSDQQISFVGGALASNGNYVSSGITLNAGKAEMYGVEIEGLFQFSPVDLLSANVQWLHAEYKDFTVPRFNANPIPPVTSCAVAPARAVPGGFFFDTDCAGQDALNSPEWSVNLGYEHTFEFDNGMDLVAGARTTIESSRYLDVSYVPEARQAGYMVTDAFVTLKGPENRWSLTAFVNNIEDEEILANVGLRPVLDIPYGVLRPPRTYGLRAAVHF